MSRDNQLSESRRIPWRLLILIAGLCGFAGVVALHSLNLQWLYNRLFHLWVGGWIDFNKPFVDISEFFAALECHRQGIDVFLADPCHVERDSPHVYPVLLDLWRFLDFGVGAAPYAGIGIDLLFLCAIAWIANPQTMVETVIYLLALFSSAVAFALVAANMDVVIFILLVVACTFYCRSAKGRLVGYGVIYLAGILKFYPVAAIGIMLKEKPKRLLITGLIFVLAYAGFLYAAWHDLMEMTIPRPSTFGGGIGGKNLREIVQTLLALRFPYQYQDVFVASQVIFIGAILASVAASIVMARKALQAGIRLDLSSLDRVLFLASASPFIGLFFIDMSLYYRAILLLAMLPLFIRLRRNAIFAQDFRKSINAGLVAMIVLLWFGLFHFGNFMGYFRLDIFLIVLVREQLWWFLITIIMSLMWVQLGALWPFRQRSAWSAITPIPA